MEAIIEKYAEVVSRRDLRVENWFLMSSPWPTLSICLTYVLIVKVIGPKFMEKREPFDLRNILVIYNGLQVIFSAWLFYEYGRGGWFHGYSFTCQPVDYSNDEMAIRVCLVPSTIHCFEGGGSKKGRLNFHLCLSMLISVILSYFTCLNT